MVFAFFLSPHPLSSHGGYITIEKKNLLCSPPPISSSTAGASVAGSTVLHLSPPLSDRLFVKRGKVIFRWVAVGDCMNDEGRFGGNGGVSVVVG